MIKETINRLKQIDRIPSIGAFEITESLVQDYVFLYGKLSGRSTGVGTKSNLKYARRLAGLNLLKESISRGIKPTEIKAGHIYLISNKAFPLHYKIGVSFDSEKRLAQYQNI